VWVRALLSRERWSRQVTLSVYLSSPPPRPKPTATSTTQGLSVSNAPGGPGAATGLQAEAHCEAVGSRIAVADLSWTVAASRGQEQRVALTTFRDGFDTNNFDLSPPLPADATSFRWRGLNPGGVHYWRVLTRHA